jgi:antitoxin MazE
MRTRIIRVGNSRGIRIPKPLLEQTGLHGEVELEVDGDRLVVRSAERARSGWEEAYREMNATGEDALVDVDATPSPQWDDESWRW